MKYPFTNNSKATFNTGWAGFEGAQKKKPPLKRSIAWLKFYQTIGQSKAEQVDFCFAAASAGHDKHGSFRMLDT